MNNQIQYLSQFENLDTLIFSLLTRQQTIIVGSKNDCVEFFEEIKQILPKVLLQHLNLGEKIGESVVVCLNETEENMVFLDKHQHEFTIIFLETKEVYGSFTAKLCKKVEKLIKEDKLQLAKKEIELFYRTATENDELMNPADYASKYGVNKGDASLLMWIRVLHLGKNPNDYVNNNVW